MTSIVLENLRVLWKGRVTRWDHLVLPEGMVCRITDHQPGFSGIIDENDGPEYIEIPEHKLDFCCPSEMVRRHLDHELAFDLTIYY